jgi:hypothetical protein
VQCSLISHAGPCLVEDWEQMHLVVVAGATPFLIVQTGGGSQCEVAAETLHQLLFWQLATAAMDNDSLHSQASSFFVKPSVKEHMFWYELHVLLAIAQLMCGSHFVPPAPPQRQAPALYPSTQSVGALHRRGSVFI